MASREERFIDTLRALARDPAARGLDDDVAVLSLGHETLIITHDMMAQGVHWLDGQDEADIAWKLVATNLSDLAAKGAVPVGVLLGYALGPDDARFAQGLRDVLDAHGVPLLGGDTIAPPPGGRTHGLTALGRASHVPVPSRSGAQPDEVVWVTGRLGGAMIGFEALRDGLPGIDSTAFRRPCPRLNEGMALAPQVGAMMDLSDGLLIDAARMARASGVTIAIDSARVPLADTVPADRRRDAMAWGDDYELLFTLPAGIAPPAGIFASAIGRVNKSGAHSLLLDGAPPQGRLGFWHD